MNISRNLKNTDEHNYDENIKRKKKQLREKKIVFFQIFFWDYVKSVKKERKM